MNESKKVGELVGAELDYWVAEIEWVEVELRDYGWAIRHPFDPEGPANEFSSCHDWMWVKYSPSTDWAQAGPIIEREKIQLWTIGAEWMAKVNCMAGNSGIAPTPLAAAMRAYVASVYGDEVSDGPA